MNTKMKTLGTAIILFCLSFSSLGFSESSKYTAAIQVINNCSLWRHGLSQECLGQISGDPDVVKLFQQSTYFYQYIGTIPFAAKICAAHSLYQSGDAPKLVVGNASFEVSGTTCQNDFVLRNGDKIYITDDNGAGNYGNITITGHLWPKNL